MGKLGITASTTVFVYMRIAKRALEQMMMDNCNQFSVKRKHNSGFLGTTQVAIVRQRKCIHFLCLTLVEITLLFDFMRQISS